jgi:hypothetical protein
MGKVFQGVERGFVMQPGITLDYVTYVSLSLMHESSVIAKYGDTYLYLIPRNLSIGSLDEFNKTIRKKLSELLKGIDINALPSLPTHLYHLLVASAARAWSDVVDIVKLVWAKPDLTVVYFDTVPLSGYKPLIKALIANDKNELFTKFVAQVIRDYTSNDKDKVNRAKPFVEVLRDLSLLSFTLSIGSKHAKDALYDTLHDLKMIKPEQVGKAYVFKFGKYLELYMGHDGAGIYMWALRRLGKIIQDTYKNGLQYSTTTNVNPTH